MPLSPFKLQLINENRKVVCIYKYKENVLKKKSAFDLWLEKAA
jgi:hypothetical protein